MKTKKNVIGFVAAFPIPEVIRNINAFTLGAKSVNPNVKVVVTWTNTWYDPAKEKAAALALIERGSDIIAQDQDTPAAQQAAEEKGLFSTGFNTDMSKTALKANMASAIWNWGPYYVSAVNEIKAGTWKTGSYWGGPKDNVVDFVINDNAPAGAKEKTTNAKADIISGKLNVFAGPIKDQKGVEKVKAGEALSDKDAWNIDWFVEGVEGIIPAAK